MKNSRRTFLASLAALVSLAPKANAEMLKRVVEQIKSANKAASVGTIKFNNLTGLPAQMIISPSITNSSTFSTVQAGSGISSTGNPGDPTALGTKSYIYPTSLLPATPVKYPAAGETVTYDLVLYQGEFKISLHTTA